MAKSDGSGRPSPRGHARAGRLRTLRARIRSAGARRCGWRAVLSDARLVRLAGLHALGEDRALWPKSGAPLAIGLLDDRPDRWGRLPRSSSRSRPMAQRTGCRRGSSTVARPSRVRNRRSAAAGPCSPAPRPLRRRRLPRHPLRRAASPDRGARRTGRRGTRRLLHLGRRCRRIRVAGLVRKRLLPRLKQAGVDVQGLRGHVIRLRGTRSATNPALIPVMVAEQIEIVR